MSCESLRVIESNFTGFSAKPHHAHLSEDIETAIKVGQRHGKPVVLIVKSRLMHSQGHQFFISDNGVWLSDHVRVVYLDEFETGREGCA